MPLVLDFENAFDISPRELLKCKLHGYGTRRKPLVWIDSVQHATKGCSQWCKISIGICFVRCTLGHCSRSLLFSLYKNAVIVGIQSEIRLFADTCYRLIDSIEDTSKLHKDIDQLGNWARKWSIRFTL